jgi:hypothetical protein
MVMLLLIVTVTRQEVCDNTVICYTNDEGLTCRILCRILR